MSLEKKISVIDEVKINNATYEQNPQTFMPTFVNFFFGKNGSGKSTIAKNIYALTGTKWQDGYAPDDYTRLLYDADFIRENMKSYEDLPGVFSVNKENIEIENKIKAEQKIIEDNEQSIRDLKTKKKETEEKITAAFTALKNACWSKGKDEESTFPKISVTGRSKDQFAQAILSLKKPSAYDLESLKIKYAAAFGENSHAYKILKSVEPIKPETMPGFSMMDKIITNSAQNPFNDFWQSLSALPWVKEGHRQFSDSAGKKCPYCKQTLPDDFEKQFAACFDEKYNADMKALREFIFFYDQGTKIVTDALSDNGNNPALDVDDSAPFLDEEQFKRFWALYANIVQTRTLNLQELRRKEADPSLKVKLEDIDKYIKEISDLVKKFNDAITANNNIVNDRNTSQRECGEEIRSHIAHTLRAELDKYRMAKKAAESEIKKIDVEITAKKNAVTTAKHEIETLGKQVVNTKESIDNINAILENAGFQGFRIVEKSGKENAYEIIRDNGKLATDLSEGERNFIMFLYFYQMVRGSKKSEDALKDKIVIIDDPVTSMDSGSVFVVGSLIREMVEICSHNVAWDLEINDPYRIRQIFIFTHNTYFHRSITYQMDAPKYYECVSFFLVRKDRTNCSFIDYCIQDSTAVAHTKENYNPVKDTYEALWEEYQKATAPTPLLNVIRQIIEYYFLHTCSYSLDSMQEDILQTGIFLNDDGSENNDAKRLAKNMLSQIQNASNGLSSGIEYAENAEDAQAVKVYRNTFRDIFRALRQEQHYNHMVRKEQ